MRTLCAFALFAATAAAACDQPAADPNFIVKLPSHPFDVVTTLASPDAGCWLFVSMPAAGIAVLHRDNGRVEFVRTVKVKDKPLGMVLTHDGKTLIAAAGNSVDFLDVGQLTSGKGKPAAARISDGKKAGSVYVNVTADDKFLFVADESTQSITVVDLEHGRKIVGKIPVGQLPIALTFSPDQRYLYTTSETARPQWKWQPACTAEAQPKAAAVPEGAVVVIDVSSAKLDPANSVVALVPAGCSPVRMAISPSGDRVYVTARSSNLLLAFDTAKLLSDPQHARIASAPVGPAPVPVAVFNQGKYIVVGNSNRFAADQSKPQQLDVLTADPLQVVGHIPAGAFPRETSFSPDGNTLFLTNFSSDSLQVIDLKRAVSQ